ncbi:hypothetical protein [Hymenobacter sp. B81]|uniref:hypothetical protein n=1 Tax=Hymenobacter sp. B81 TaxID=3344878 RepID=UPI0037DC0A55
MNTPAPLRLADALALLEGPAPVSVRYVTCDRRRKTGGEFRELKAARLGRGQRTESRTLRAATPAENTAAGADVRPVPVPKNPNHYANATRNLVDTRTGELVKVHIYLIVAVQGRKVII